MPKALSESALHWVILAQLKRHHMCTAHHRQMATCVSRTWSWPRHWPQTENSGERCCPSSITASWVRTQIKPESLETKKTQQPTYFEPGCCYRTLSVALIQRDDGDDVLGVRLQAGEGVHLAVAGQLHRLYFTTFFPIIKTETIDRRADASKAQTVTGLPAHL